MRRQQRAWLNWSVAALLALTAVARLAPAAPGSSTAAPTYRRTFSATAQDYFRTLQRCVRVSISGSARFRVVEDTGYTAFYRARRVVDPVLTVQTFPRCATGPMPSKPVYAMTLFQGWTATGCSSTGGGGPGCPGAGLASWKTSYRGYRSEGAQHVRASISLDDEYLTPLAWGHQYGGRRRVRAPWCFDVTVYVEVQARRLGGSDTDVTSLRPCVRYW